MKTFSDAVFPLNAENCLLKWLPHMEKKWKWKKFEVHFISLRHLLSTPKFSKYIQGHIDREFSLYIPQGEKGYLTHKMINYGECKAKWLQQFSGALLVPFNLYRLFCSCCGDFFFNSASFLFSCSLLSLITLIVHGLLSLKIICCLVYLPCSYSFTAVHQCHAIQTGEWNHLSLQSKGSIFIYSRSIKG